MAINRLWIPIVATALSAWLLAAIAQAIASVYFNPLSHVPGPKIAAATKWWRVYHELIKQVSWTDKLIELHSIYGNQNLFA